MSSTAKAMIGLCPTTPPTGIIPCDTQCFGKAATNLGVNWAKAETKLQKQLTKNTQAWAEANNNYIQFLLNYSEAKTISQMERLVAFDGVAGKITTAIDKCTLTFQRNIDSLALAYTSTHLQLRKADEVMQNANGQFSEVLPPYRDWLMNNAEAFHSESQGVANIDAALVASADDEFNLSARERVVSLSINEEDIDYNELILRDVLTQEEFVHLSEYLSLLYVDNTALDTVEGRRARMKQQIGIKVLLESKTVVSDQAKASQGLSKSIASFSRLIESDDTLSMTSPHHIQSSKAFSQGIYNALLHEYLTKKKLKNALVATHLAD